MNQDRSSDSELTAAELSFLDRFPPTSMSADSIEGEHQRDLRRNMLDAFDRAQPSGDLVVASSVQRPSSRQWLVVLAGLAACGVAIVSYTVLRTDDGVDGAIAKRAVPAIHQDHAEYLAVFNTVSEYRGEISQDEVFLALAMCEQRSSPVVSTGSHD